MSAPCIRHFLLARTESYIPAIGFVFSRYSCNARSLWDGIELAENHIYGFLMRTILRQIVLLFVGLLFWYGLALAVSLYVVPAQELVDTGNQEKNLHNLFEDHRVGTVRTLAFEMWKLQRKEKPKLIFFGSSNVFIGFRPEYLEPLFPEYEIAILAIPGGNISEAMEVIRILRAGFPEGSFQDSVFVVGMFHLLVCEPQHPNPDLLREGLLKSGFYILDGESIKPRFPAKVMDITSGMLRPYFFFQYLVRAYDLNRLKPERMIPQVGKRLGSRTYGLSWERAVANENKFGWKGRKPFNRPLTEEQRQWIREWYGLGMPRDSLEPYFEQLLDLCKLTEEMEVSLVLIDMPLADWHQKTSPRFPLYQKTKKEYINRTLKYPHVRYYNFLDLPGFSEASTFYDHVHPFKEIARKWSETLRKLWDLDPPE